MSSKIQNTRCQMSKVESGKPRRQRVTFKLSLGDVVAVSD